MIRVRDVRATAEWYASIGFTLRASNDDDGEINWAALSFGTGEVMFQLGEHRNTEYRPVVDLYVNVEEGLEELCRQLKDRAELVEDLHDTFYGMREFIIRDINGFWITFGQPSGKPRADT